MTQDKGLLDYLSHFFGAPPYPAPSETAHPTHPAAAPAAPPPPPVPAVDRTMEIIADPRVPPKCRDKAYGIVAALDALKPRIADRGPADEIVIEIHRMREAHIAELLQRYVDIPEEHRAEIFRRTQKSASYHLGASLDVMATRVSEISKALAQGVLDQFTDSTRFVDTQYGHANDPFA